MPPIKFRPTIVWDFVIDYADHNDYHSHNKERTMTDQAWTVAQAKAKFSEVIEKAASQGPQTITRNGRRAAVLVAAHEWDRKTKRKGTLADFFAASPLRGSGLNLERLPIRLRPIRLGKLKP
jgi:prevent-host-death family protein